MSESSMFSLASQRCVLIFGHCNCHYHSKPMEKGLRRLIRISSSFAYYSLLFYTSSANQPSPTSSLSSSSSPSLLLWSSFSLLYVQSGLHRLQLVRPPSSQATKGTKGFSLSHCPLFSLKLSLFHSKNMRSRLND